MRDCNKCGEAIEFLLDGNVWIPVDADSVTGGDKQFEAASGHVRHDCTAKEQAVDDALWTSIEQTKLDDRGAIVVRTEITEPDWDSLISVLDEAEEPGPDPEVHADLVDAMALSFATANPAGYKVRLESYFDQALTRISKDRAIEEISVTELANITGRTVSNITQMIKRGILPQGEKRGKIRFLPTAEAVRIVTQQERPGQHRKPRAKRNTQDVSQTTSADIDWNSLI